MLLLLLRLLLTLPLPLPLSLFHFNVRINLLICSRLWNQTIILLLLIDERTAIESHYANSGSFSCFYFSSVASLIMNGVWLLQHDAAFDMYMFVCFELINEVSIVKLELCSNVLRFIASYYYIMFLYTSFFYLHRPIWLLGFWFYIWSFFFCFANMQTICEWYRFLDF